MKKYLSATLLVVAVLCFAAVQSKAQDTWGVRADVPFDFIVGDETLPAGTVSARGLNARQSGTLSITNHDIGQNMRRIGQRLTSSSATDDAKLVFHKYGDRYYLAEIWVPGYVPWQIEKSRSELALERETRLSNHTRRRVVTVIAVSQ